MAVNPCDGIVGRLAGFEPRSGSPLVLAIDGPAGAGKTVLAADIANAVDRAEVVAMDDLYTGWSGLEQGSKRLVELVLGPICSGRKARFSRWDWHADGEGEAVTVASCDVLIVEGVGCAPVAAGPMIDLLVWVDAAAEERRRRALERDGEVFAAHWDAWARQEDVLFEREQTRERADAAVITDAPGGATVQWLKNS